MRDSYKYSKSSQVKVKGFSHQIHFKYITFYISHNIPRKHYYQMILKTSTLTGCKIFSTILTKNIQQNVIKYTKEFNNTKHNSKHNAENSAIKNLVMTSNYYIKPICKHRTISMIIWIETEKMLILTITRRQRQCYYPSRTREAHDDVCSWREQFGCAAVFVSV